MVEITKERSDAYVEVLEVIRNMEKKYQEMIPLKVIDFFKKNASTDYVFIIDPSKPLEQYRLNEITLNVLAMLNLNYWCEDEKHKQELIKQYKENELRSRRDIEKDYDIYEVFTKRKEKTQARLDQIKQEEQIVDIELDLIDCEESEFKKSIKMKKYNFKKKLEEIKSRIKEYLKKYKS